jgi:hypothetical protein
MSFTDVFTNHRQVCFEEIKKVLRKNNNEVNLRDFIVVTINCGNDYIQNVYISKVVLENDKIFCCEETDCELEPNKYDIKELTYLEDIGELTDYLVNL